MNLTLTAPRAEGFTNQRLSVVPRPQLDAMGSRALQVTDAGYFPSAVGHQRARERGIEESIVIVCTAGSGSARIGHHDHAVGPSACVVLPAGRPHACASSAADPWTIWWLHVRNADIAGLTSGRLGGPEAVVHLRRLDRVAALFDELVTSLERSTSSTRLLAASGVAYHLLTRIAVDSAMPADGSPLERAMGYLEARVDGTIRMSELAALVGVSASHLSAQFHRATGGGPGAYFTSVKMARARTLLDTTALSVAEVAVSVGYSDPLYFSRHFRRIHGVSPSAYRADVKG